MVLDDVAERFIKDRSGVRVPLSEVFDPLGLSPLRKLLAAGRLFLNKGEQI